MNYDQMPEDKRPKGFMHCRECMNELPRDGTAMREYARIEVAYTETGLYIGCVRHNRVIVHLVPFQAPPKHEL